VRIIDLRSIRELGLKRHQTSLHFGLSHFVILGATRSVREAHFPNWRLVHVDEGLVSSPKTVLWMIQWCALVVMGASWDTSTTAISASPPSRCAAFGRTMCLLWWVYPQDAALGDSGLGVALAASRSGVRTGRPPLRSGLHEKVLNFLELTCLYPSLHGATWRMWVRSVSGPLGSLVKHLATWSAARIRPSRMWNRSCSPACDHFSSPTRQ
jgi:hypothetical protein